MNINKSESFLICTVNHDEFFCPVYIQYIVQYLTKK